jgi:hypothetical protein
MVERKTARYAPLVVELRHSEQLLDSGREWRAGEPIEIRMRRRGYWTELDDSGEAVRRGGRPEGWHEAADRIAAAEGMNVSRTGTVSVKYGQRSGHDLEEITGRLADTARAIYLLLLDLSEE